MSDKVRVAVRLRPLNRRERGLGADSVVEMEGRQARLLYPDSKGPVSKEFTFDHCFDSRDPERTEFADQAAVFKAVGSDILNNAFKGYNAAIFAYGQTGSGKSYSMMGTQEEPGIIPRLCVELFRRMAAVSDPANEATVEVSYMEIYNERVHDLLDLTPGSKKSLKVREHSLLGPYVDGLSQLAVLSYQEIEDLMIEGNKSRTVAATSMNSESSRSHAVFTLLLTFTTRDPGSGVTGETVSRISLVDLAGSERAMKTGAVGERLKEGSNINKSLTTLGLVISKLAEQSSGKAKDKFVPYRDSVLTWLLKDSLGGNSRTVMVATVSPAADSYEETLSTLRYADRAKRIVNHAVVNEDPNAKIIRELRAEVEALKDMLLHAAHPEILKEKLCENEKLMREMSLTWEEKLHKTEQLQEDRRNALERMGISVQSSGIKVEKNKYFLVNLNADPSLNELLVYYLKERNLVGREEASVPQDIQLSGLGIQLEHCILEISANRELTAIPLPGARTCVNGAEILSRTLLRNGDRILWGSNHFFRVNCPRLASDVTPTTPFDWRMAQEEVMMAENGVAPVREAIARLERRYEQDKIAALELQRREYERHFEQLRQMISPSAPQESGFSYDLLRMSRMSTSACKLGIWEGEVWRAGLARLREELVRAQGLVREANLLAEELLRPLTFSLTLQIPAHQLTPHRRQGGGGVVCEPAILVKRKGGPPDARHVWSLASLENKLVDMRELYADHMECLTTDSNPTTGSDPFLEAANDGQSLVGVANVYLDVLFHDNLELDYLVPIVSQQGEVSGRLRVLLRRLAGRLPTDRVGQCEALSESSGGQEDEEEEDSGKNLFSFALSIKEAVGVPGAESQLIFCEYPTWWAVRGVGGEGEGPESEIVPPIQDPAMGPYQSERYSKCTPPPTTAVVRFDHSRTWTVPLTEEFLDFCSDGALSIEVYSHKLYSYNEGQEVEAAAGQRWAATQACRARTLADRWQELTRKVELRVDIQELNEEGEYVPVEVVVDEGGGGAGGTFQLRQGQQRRIGVTVRPLSSLLETGSSSGTLPLICDTVIEVAVGSPCMRSRLQRPLDSYQEEDLGRLRERWNEALDRRRQYLEAQIKQQLEQQHDCKTAVEAEREQSLLEQWVHLTEERNAVSAPSEHSGVPGAPTPLDRYPAPGTELHHPVLFLDLQPDEIAATTADINGGDFEAEDEAAVPLYCHQSILPKEHGGRFYSLPIVRQWEAETAALAVASWDSSIHDSVHLNRLTEPGERAYLIVRVVARLSHPRRMDIMLRKRICFIVYKQQRFSLSERIRRRIAGVAAAASAVSTQTPAVRNVGVIYDVVGHVPTTSEELEARESLAVLAATTTTTAVADTAALASSGAQECFQLDGESFIEKYTRAAAAVDELLRLDKLRQQVAVRELLARAGWEKGRSRLPTSGRQSMRKTFSVPNFRHAMKTSVSLDSLAVFHSPLLRPSESFSDLNCELTGRTPPCQRGIDYDSSSTNYVHANEADSSSCGRYPLRRLPLSLTMSTLHEERGNCSRLADETSPEELTNRRNFMGESCTFDNVRSSPPESSEARNIHSLPSHSLLKSQTVESLAELHAQQQSQQQQLPQPKNGSPSLLSSGYESQAVSLTTLSSEDSLSVRSMSVEEEGGNQEAESDIGRLSDLTAEIGLRSGNNSKYRSAVVVEEESRSATAVVMRRNGALRNWNKHHQNRLSCPSSLISLDHRPGNRLQAAANRSTDNKTSSAFGTSNVNNNSRHDEEDENEEDGFGGDDAAALPDWLTIGESVQVRPNSLSGVVRFLGPTRFAPGLWVGVELDTSRGKNDGSVEGVRYFSCAPRRGMFVRPRSLHLDRRGREMRVFRNDSGAGRPASAKVVVRTKSRQSLAGKVGNGM